MAALSDLIPSNRPALWLPMDDALIAGPDRWLRDPRQLFTPELLADVDAVLGFGGLAARCAGQLKATPFIQNLTASTARRDHTRKVEVGSIGLLSERGNAGAVACHVNLTSPSESEQLEMLGRMAQEAHVWQLPLVAIVYPRTVYPNPVAAIFSEGAEENYTMLRRDSPEAYTALVRQCVRVAVELGADYVKTVYTGSEESFRTVVQSAMGVPVLVAGGAVTDDADALHRARSAVYAGAAGVAFGRQIHQNADPFGFVAALRTTLDEAYSSRKSRE